MNSSSNPPTLRELMRPVIRHRWLLLAFIVVAIAASIAYSSTKKPVYRSSAAISYQDESYDLGLVGLSAPPTQTGVQLAAAGAQTIIQPSVADKVKRDLHSRLSTGALSHSVTATVEPSSNLVLLQASAPTAIEAQRLANAFATRGADATNDHVRAVYGAAYSAALHRLHHPAGGAKLDLAAQVVENEQLSRLQVLASIASSAKVVLPANLPGSPASPRPVRDAGLAGGLGLLLGLFAVYVRESFDRRLRSASDVEEQFPVPLLGHVRVEVLGRSPRDSGNKSRSKPVMPADWELFRILGRNLDFLEPDQTIRTIAVTSSLPEEGKSTVAAFLAFTSAAAGKRTMLIECDLRRPVLAQRLGIERSPGLSDYVLGGVERDEVVQTIPFSDPMSTNGAGSTNGRAASGKSKLRSAIRHELACITAGTPTPHAVEILRSPALSELLAEVREAYDLVILDTPPLLSVVDTLELLPQVDGAIVCVRVMRTTRQQASAGRAALGRLPGRPTGLVVTGTQKSSEAEYGYYGYYA